MTILDESASSNRVVETYNTYTGRHHSDHNEVSPLMIVRTNERIKRSKLLWNAPTGWVPGYTEAGQSQDDTKLLKTRSWNRRLFLLLTEPESSYASTVFYFLLMTAIFAANVIMIIQTMDYWQFTPSDCHSCGGTVTYMFEDDAFVEESSSRACVCPPSPLPITNHIIDWLMYFFTAEWMLRVALFAPAKTEPTMFGRFCQWFSYLTETSTLIDALGIFPYYLESLPNSFVSLRLVRLFRILQLVRLGQYNEMFLSLTNVLQKSVNYLKLLLLILTFGAAFFGSMVYWLEKGSWKYHEASGGYRFLRVSVDGVTEEPTPFNSIPSSFWWFMVTATTVGYGDYYPTTTAGKWCAMFAMLTGVLVIAFPVSVFSDLWSHELKQMKGFEDLVGDDDDDVDDTENNKRELKDPDSLRPPQTPERRYNSVDSDVVIMSKQDMKEIVECLYTIRENERQMKNILRKYHPEVRI